MRTRSAFLLAAFLLFVTAFPVWAQHPAPHMPAPHMMAPRANQGHIPPPPPMPSAHRIERFEGGAINSTQHVDHNIWYGHDLPNDPRFHLDHPFPHGHFPHPGPGFRYNIVRIDPVHHWFWLPGGYYFEVAPWDWFLCSDWCWDCGDDFVIYDDPDHPGWYLLYNVHTGIYVHVQYMGM